MRWARWVRPVRGGRGMSGACEVGVACVRWVMHM